MSWYRLAQDNSAALTKTIAQWLIQAYRGPVDMRQLHNDLNVLMPNLDDERAIDTAIISGETMARTQLHQQGDLTPSQHDVLNNIQQRCINPQPALNSGELNNVQPQEAQNVMQGEVYVENN